MSRLFHIDGSYADEGEIFVFGSNLAGRHGAGAAKAARDFFGAETGVGAGPTGRAYAIPTKDERLATLSLERVQEGVKDFVSYASANPELRFFVTRVGCGLAGFEDSTIAPLFKGAPANCSFAEQWRDWL